MRSGRNVGNITSQHSRTPACPLDLMYLYLAELSTAPPAWCSAPWPEVPQGPNSPGCSALTSRYGVWEGATGVVKKVGSYPSHWLPWWLRCYRIRLQCGRPGFSPWVGKIPWRRECQPTPVFFPGESHGQSLVGSSPCVCRVGHHCATNTALQYQPTITCRTLLHFERSGPLQWEQT